MMTQQMDRRRRVESLLREWHAEFGTRHASVQAALFAIGRNTKLREAIDQACSVRTGNAIAGALRRALAKPFDGWRVHKIVPLDDKGNKEPAKWKVEKAASTTVPPASIAAKAATPVPAVSKPVESPQPKPVHDDDRLMSVLTAAMGERCITGTQVDRILTLWCEATT